MDEAVIRARTLRHRAGAENRLAVFEEVDDPVVTHLLSHVFPPPVSGLVAGLSVYPLALLTVSPSPV